MEKHHRRLGLGLMGTISLSFPDISIKHFYSGKSAPSLGNHALPRQVAAAASIAGQTGTNTPAPIAPRRRYKKGPKRLKKAQVGPASLEQLDQEMEDYRASADASNVGS